MQAVIRTFQWASITKCIPFELISKELGDWDVNGVMAQDLRYSESITTCHCCKLQFVAAPTLVAFFVMNPQGFVAHVYSTIPSGLQSEIWVKVSWFLLETAMVYWNFTILTTMYCIWVAIVFQNILWLDELKRFNPFIMFKTTTLLNVVNLYCLSLTSARRTYGTWQS